KGIVPQFCAIERFRETGIADHQQADGDERQRRAKEPDVGVHSRTGGCGQCRCHQSSPMSAWTARRKAAPRASKSRNISKLAQAGESSTASPGTALSRAM